MEAISKLTDRAIPVILPATAQAFLPLLKAHQSDIESVKRVTFKYGTTDRHQLDVYHPVDAPGGTASVLFFVYGGGFVSGERVQPPPADLVYRNVGAFFAKKGLYTVIADYRLAPTAKHPDGAEDVKDAVEWIVKHADEVAANSKVKLNTERIFLLGHSAGASHVITSHLFPGLFPPELRSRIKGLLLNGGPYTFRPDLLPSATAIPGDILEQYYGPGQATEKEPLALFHAASQELLSSLPPILALRAEREPEAIEQMNIHFIAAVKEKISDSAIQEYILKGHNHISSSMCLSSGEGEEWGSFVVEWITSKVAA